MQASGAHGLDLGRIGLHREEQNRLAGEIGQVVEELFPHIHVDCWIFHGRVGKNQRGRIDLVRGVRRNVGNEVTVIVLVAAVQLEGGTGRQAQNRRKDQRNENTRHHRSRPSVSVHIPPSAPNGLARRRDL